MKREKLNMAAVQESFDRTDKIIAFKKELTALINSHGMDSLLEVPDYILASVAVGQMEICSSMAIGITKGHFRAVLLS